MALTSPEAKLKKLFLQHPNFKHLFIPACHLQASYSSIHSRLAECKCVVQKPSLLLLEMMLFLPLSLQYHKSQILHTHHPRLPPLCYCVLQSCRCFPPIALLAESKQESVVTSGCSASERQHCNELHVQGSVQLLIYRPGRVIGSQQTTLTTQLSHTLPNSCLTPPHECHLSTQEKELPQAFTIRQGQAPETSARVVFSALSSVSTSSKFSLVLKRQTKHLRAASTLLCWHSQGHSAKVSGLKNLHQGSESPASK